MFTETMLLAAFKFGEKFCDMLCSPEGQLLMKEWRENGDKAEAFFDRIFQRIKK